MVIVLIVSCIFSVIAIIFATVAFIRYGEINKKYNMFMLGKDAESLEDFFIDMQKNIDHLEEESVKNRESIKKLNRITKKSFQKMGFYKYDAFNEKTGKRSFALALLDFTNTGIVVTCQSVIEGAIIFVKEVDNGATKTKLGPEEEIALEIAMGQREKYQE